MKGGSIGGTERALGSTASFNTSKRRRKFFHWHWRIHKTSGLCTTARAGKRNFMTSSILFASLDWRKTTTWHHIQRMLAVVWVIMPFRPSIEEGLLAVRTVHQEFKCILYWKESSNALAACKVCVMQIELDILHLGGNIYQGRDAVLRLSVYYLLIGGVHWWWYNTKLHLELCQRTVLSRSRNRRLFWLWKTWMFFSSVASYPGGCLASTYCRLCQIAERRLSSNTFVRYSMLSWDSISHCRDPHTCTTSNYWRLAPECHTS